MATSTLQQDGSIEAQLAQLAASLGSTTFTAGNTGEMLRQINAAFTGYTPPGNSLGTTISGVTGETVPRALAAGSVTIATGTAGDLFLQAIYLPVNTVVNAVNFVTGTTGSTGVNHNWGVLASAARVVLGVSADNTSVELAASTRQTYTLGTAVTIPSSGLYYIGQMVSTTGGGAAQPTMIGVTEAGSTLNALAPILAGKSNTGATVPVALAATLTAITAAASMFYGFTS
jgi:hypothetical protein